MIAEKIPQLKNLSSAEKLALVGELWNELTEEAHSLPPRQDHIQLLRERLEHYRKNPGDVTAWEDLRTHILGSR